MEGCGEKMHTSSILNMQSFVNKYLSHIDRPIKIADIGSQAVEGQTYEYTYKKFFDQEPWQYFGCDMVAGNNVDIVFKNPYTWNEIKSGTFDVVVSGQALEHVEYIWVTILEIARIMREGGYCCIIVPSGGVLHRYPLDCWRFYEDGLSALAKWARLEVLEVYTQRSSDDFEGFDPVWQDSVLICRKPQRRFLSKIKFWLGNRIGKEFEYIVAFYLRMSLENGQI